MTKQSKHSTGLVSALAAGVLALFASRGDAVSGTIQDVQHVVILMQENRSFDHYFGALRGVHGFNDQSTLLFRNGNNAFFQPQGTNYVLPFHAPTLSLEDVRHDWDGEHAFWNSGRWDQWVPVAGPATMAYYARNDLPYYYGLADAYTICDANYCSVMGPTFPNRLFLFTGMNDPNHTGGGPSLDNNVPTNGFTWTTYPERLQAAGVTWKVYRDPNDWFGNALAWFHQFQTAVPGNPLYDRGMATVNNVVSAFKKDVTNGTLPQVSWIMPTWEQSEHPVQSPSGGETFVKQLLDALALNPSVFNSTVFIITYDENGGFFDHIPAPVPPPGTTNEFAYNQPIGLGIRVPMILVSPWTRGGRVCSQIFDHTSILRFLENWTGVQEPNISPWRRQVCGDLTSAFDFAHPDNSHPSLPSPNTTSGGTITPVPPSPQIAPVQEPGTRISMPLPYQPNVHATTDCAARRLLLTMTNSGSASVHFSIYANDYRTDGPWQFDVGQNNSATNAMVIGTNYGGAYDFTCYGPNGFQRRFVGSVTTACYFTEVASSIDPATGRLTLVLKNSTTAPVNFTITDGYGLAAPLTNTVVPGATGTNVFFALTDNSGWYDLTVAVNGEPRFFRRLAGHIEPGFPTSTATNGASASNFILPPVPPLVIIPPPPFVLPGFLSPVPDTNTLAILGTTYQTNYVLIYPAWASNYTLESSANLASGSWNQFIPPTNSLGNFPNYRVVPLPLTGPGRFFRLRR